MVADGSVELARPIVEIGLRETPVASHHHDALVVDKDLQGRVHILVGHLADARLVAHLVACGRESRIIEIRFTIAIGPPKTHRLTAELGRIEQYVDMVLTYLRLEEGGSDYVILTCAVDDVVRAAVRRFAGEFIDRRIALDYTPVEWETVRDGKWLTFVVEQLLSNALKYTGQDGTVRIYREGDDLCIRDSGMGIAPEDLPRVFDMGYTGQNGRLDRRSSGIGLYLCRRICRNLRHEIRIESAPGAGTTVRLTLGRPAFVVE